uniref:Trypanosoma vivax n=1 Tax=Trypanosoma vivax (strain Y486) TaxID=1055687 RepID=G0TXW7_TRYVY|nr:hypothetical protein TVY486_0701470 [Trypanosoma vivax Y486]
MCGSNQFVSSLAQAVLLVCDTNGVDCFCDLIHSAVVFHSLCEFSSSVPEAGPQAKAVLTSWMQKASSVYHSFVCFTYTYIGVSSFLVSFFFLVWAFVTKAEKVGGPLVE